MVLVGYIPVFKLKCFSRKKWAVEGYQLFHEYMRTLLEPTALILVWTVPMVSFGQASLFCRRTSQITPSNVWLPVAKKMPVQHAWLNQQNEAHLSGVQFYESKQRHWRSSANSHAVRNPMNMSTKVSVLSTPSGPTSHTATSFLACRTFSTNFIKGSSRIIRRPPSRLAQLAIADVVTQRPMHKPQ